MPGSDPLPTARLVSQVEIPQPPPSHPRRSGILVQGIGDLRAPEPDAGADEVANVGIVRVIGGANGLDDDVRTGAR